MSKLRLIGILVSLTTLLSFGAQIHAQEISGTEDVMQSVNLGPNNCALFVWAGYPSRLHYISRSSERLAYSAYGQVKSHSVSLNHEMDKFGQVPTQYIIGEKGLISELQLDNPSNRSKSVLYKSGTISLPNSSGWVRIENAQAVSACNDTAVDTVIGIDKFSGGFNVPPWLETPEELEEAEKLQLSNNFVQEAIPEPRTIISTDIVSATQVTPITQVLSITTALESEAAQTLHDNTLQLVSMGKDASVGSVLNEASLQTVQIGAFASPALAQRAWLKLQENAEYLGEYQHSLQMADIEDLGILYRLRVAGLQNRRSAVALCRRLKFDDVDCFVPKAE